MFPSLPQRLTWLALALGGLALLPAGGVPKAQTPGPRSRGGRGGRRNRYPRSAYWKKFKVGRARVGQESHSFSTRGIWKV